MSVKKRLLSYATVLFSMYPAFDCESGTAGDFKGFNDIEGHWAQF